MLSVTLLGALWHTAPLAAIAPRPVRLASLYKIRV